MSATAAPTKPSSMCRNDEHSLCKSVRAKCNCPCHEGGPQMPPAPAERPRAVPDTPPSTVVFEDPPAGGRKGLKDRLALELEAVAARPGEWARIARYTSASGASAAATALRKNPPKGRWEFRGVAKDGASFLYVRFVGA